MLFHKGWNTGLKNKKKSNVEIHSLLILHRPTRKHFCFTHSAAATVNTLCVCVNESGVTLWANPGQTQWKTLWSAIFTLRLVFLLFIKKGCWDKGSSQFHMHIKKAHIFRGCTTVLCELTRIIYLHFRTIHQPEHRQNHSDLHTFE